MFSITVLEDLAVANESQPPLEIHSTLGDAETGDREFEVFQFSATATSRLVAATTHGFDPAAADTVLRLFDADGAELALNDDARLPGDFDFDAIVDGDDFLVWQREFALPSGSRTRVGPYRSGDANKDGAVDGSDFLTWQSQFGETGTYQGTHDALIDHVFAEDGIYFLAVSGFGNQSYDAFDSNSGSPGRTGAYELALQLIGDPGPQREPTGVTAEVLQGILSIRGTDGQDHIRVTQNGDYLEVYDADFLRGSFNANVVQGMQIVALGDNDVIDVHEVSVSAWIYAGGGDDTVLGTANRDTIFGGEGNDTLHGNAGDDVLYGDAGEADSLIGGPGADYLSQSPRTTLASLPAGDRDIEAFSYDEREYFDLLNRHRDAWGFVINHNGDGAPDDINDGMIFTGIALATTALRGDSQATLELLETLRDRTWAEFDGADRLIRHPNSFDFIRSGDTYVRERNQPVTKDGVVGVTAGVYYAYTAAGMTDEVRAAARETLDAYIAYLVSNHWKTVDHYPDHYWETEPKPEGEGDYFVNVFSDENEGRITAKGPDAYTLSPTDIYALQNVGADLGFVTSTWDPWETFAASIAQVAGDYLGPAIEAAGERLAAWVGMQVDQLLRQINVSHDYSFHVIPGVDWTLVEGDVSFALSNADRDNIVSAVESIVRNGVGALGMLVDEVTEIPAMLAELDGITGQIADEIIDVLPDWLVSDSFRDATTAAVQQVLPYLNGGVWGELIAFSLASEMAKSDEIVAHSSFWPTLMMYETRPDMRCCSARP